MDRGECTGTSWLLIPTVSLTWLRSSLFLCSCLPLRTALFWNQYGVLFNRPPALRIQPVARLSIHPVAMAAVCILTPFAVKTKSLAAHLDTSARLSTLEQSVQVRYVPFSYLMTSRATNSFEPCAAIQAVTGSLKPADLNFPCGQFQGQDCKCATLCMPGPEYNASSSQPTCLVLGDSVSIGYTPHLVAMLNDSCFVQHSPWSSDGGACSTSYALSCIDVFTSTAQLYPIKPNVYLFNFGLHDYNLNSAAFFDEYVSELTKIRDRLLQSGAKVLWATTTPVPYSSDINDVVNILNEKALSEVMNPAQIPSVDLYQAVIDRCGPSPFWNCPISLNRPGKPNVHYNSDGYQYLASVISPAIKKLLETV